jgi:hypothetical protein
MRNATLLLCTLIGCHAAWADSPPATPADRILVN